MSSVAPRRGLVYLGLSSILVGTIFVAVLLPYLFAQIGHASEAIQQQHELLEAERIVENQQSVQPREPIQPGDVQWHRPSRRTTAPASAGRPSPESVESQPQKSEQVEEPEPTHVTCGTGQVIPTRGRHGSEVTPCGGGWYVADSGLPIQKSWMDQPSSRWSGVVRTDLRYRWEPTTTKKTSDRAPCLVPVRKPAGRQYLPNAAEGYIDVPARTVFVPCSDVR